MMNLLFLPFFCACLADMSASLSSSVLDEAGTPIENVTVNIYDLNEELYSTSITDSDGSFQISLPPLQTFFAILDHDDFMTTSHTGFAGEGSTVLEQDLIIQSNENVTLRQADYTDCDLQAGFIEGEVRVAIPEQDIAEMPIVTAARAIAYDLNYVGTPACYIDPTTEPPQTGDSGRYLVTNLHEGIHEVLLTVQYDAQTQKEFYYLVYVPLNGIAPLLPTLIPL